MIKIPIDIANSPASAQKLYAIFLDFKAFSSSGLFSKKDLNRRTTDRFYYNYWLKKLISAGWIIIRNGQYQCLSYQAVWQKMGCRRYFIKKINRTRFKYVTHSTDQLPDKRQDYIPHIKNLISKLITDRKRKQIRRMLTKGKSKSNSTKNTPTSIPLSCKKVASWFGLRSSRSGMILREKFLQPQHIPGLFNHNGVLRRQCSIVAI